MLCPSCFELNVSDAIFCGQCGFRLREGIAPTSVAEYNIPTYVKEPDNTRIPGNDDTTFIKGTDATISSSPQIFNSSTVSGSIFTRSKSVKPSEEKQSRQENLEKTLGAIGVGFLKLIETIALFAIGGAILVETFFAHIALEQRLTWSSYMVSGWQLWLSGAFDNTNQNTANNLARLYP